MTNNAKRLRRIDVLPLPINRIPIEEAFVPLPLPPKTKSPVPWLTSLHGRPGRGNYGNASYRGNCSGLLIRDLLQFYRPTRVLDPMAGSGTCRDVCRELHIECVSLDIRTGNDASRPNAFQTFGQFDFVWLHPPYWQMVHWSDDPCCLSHCPTHKDFRLRLTMVLQNCMSAMTASAHIAILMGDYPKEGEHQALPFWTWHIATKLGLVLAAPEIIRFSHGATSRKREYSTSFIPRLHDVCLVFKRHKVLLKHTASLELKKARKRLNATKTSTAI